MKRLWKNVILLFLMAICLVLTIFLVRQILPETTTQSVPADMRPTFNGAPPTGSGEEIGTMEITGEIESDGTDAVASATPPAGVPQEGARQEFGNMRTRPNAFDTGAPTARDGAPQSEKSVVGYAVGTVLAVFGFAFLLMWAIFSRMNAVSPFAQKAVAAENTENDNERRNEQ